MARVNFFSVLKSNLKCAMCKNKNCKVRYFPNREDVTYLNGTKYVMRCEQDKKKEENRILKKR